MWKKDQETVAGSNLKIFDLLQLLWFAFFAIARTSRCNFIGKWKLKRVIVCRFKCGTRMMQEQYKG